MCMTFCIFLFNTSGLFVREHFINKHESENRSLVLGSLVLVGRSVGTHT